MKFNWGTGIFLVIIIFLGIMASIIVFSMNQQVNLVSPDYYPKGVNHEEHLQKQRNFIELGAKIICRKENDSLKISFPAYFKGKTVSGKIQFYFMTNFKKDMERDISLDTNLRLLFPINQFETGRYLLKLDWTDGKKPYYHEIDINL